MNRTLRVMKRYCASNITGDECAKQIFGATILGKNWMEINKKLASLSQTSQNNVIFFNSSLSRSEETNIIVFFGFFSWHNCLMMKSLKHAPNPTSVLSYSKC